MIIKELNRKRVLLDSDTENPTQPGKPVITINNGFNSVDWTASTDNVGIAYYQVWRATDVVMSDGLLIGTPTSNTFFDNTYTQGGNHYYRVKAVDTSGNLSIYSLVSNLAVNNSLPA